MPDWEEPKWGPKKSKFLKFRHWIVIEIISLKRRAKREKEEPLYHSSIV